MNMLMNILGPWNSGTCQALYVIGVPVRSCITHQVFTSTLHRTI